MPAALARKLRATKLNSCRERRFRRLQQRFTMKVLVVGGAGYIGSHCVRQLVAAGHTPVVLDNLVYGHRAAVSPTIKLHDANLGDEAVVGRILSEEKIEL